MLRVLPGLLAAGLFLMVHPLSAAAQAPPAQGRTTTSEKTTSEKPVCPVTLKEVEITENRAYSDYRGRQYYFCCPACKPIFDKNPGKYVRALEAKRKAAKRRAA